MGSMKRENHVLLGEEVVEEWLNRNGYFTIRGIRVRVDEIDILAIRPLPDGKHECRHIEVQLSINSISNDPALLAAALGDIARARGMNEIAKASGLTREALYKALRPNAKPRYDTIVKVCRRWECGWWRRLFMFEPSLSKE